jgi:hypothetical protein
MPINVRHKACGGKMGEWFGERGGTIIANLFVRVDGTKPTSGEIINERCPVCGEIAYSFYLAEDVQE